MQSNIVQFCSGVRAVPKVSPHEFQTCWRVLIGQNFFKETTGDLEFVWLVFVSRVVSRFHLHRKRINFAAINLEQFAVERLAVPPHVPYSPLEHEQLFSRSLVWKLKVRLRSLQI